MEPRTLKVALFERYAVIEEGIETLFLLRNRDLASLDGIVPRTIVESEQHYNCGLKLFSGEITIPFFLYKKLKSHVSGVWPGEICGSSWREKFNATRLSELEISLLVTLVEDEAEKLDKLNETSI